MDTGGREGGKRYSLEGESRRGREHFMYDVETVKAKKKTRAPAVLQYNFPSRK